MKHYRQTKNQCFPASMCMAFGLSYWKERKGFKWTQKNHREWLARLPIPDTAKRSISRQMSIAGSWINSVCPLDKLRIQWHKQGILIVRRDRTCHAIAFSQGCVHDPNKYGSIPFLTYFLLNNWDIRTVYYVNVLSLGQQNGAIT